MLVWGLEAFMTYSSSAEAQEQLFAYIATLKLTEQKRREYEQEGALWEGRVKLAQSKGRADLQAAAQTEVARIRVQQAELDAECTEYKAQIQKLRAALPSIAARDRTIDTDLLEQELLIAAGYNPGEEEKAKVDRAFADTEKREKNDKADAALAALKAKMSGDAL
jgi:phage shock protein A